MSGVATAVVAGSVISGKLAGNAAKSAANTSANAQIQAAQIAAEQSKFRPVGMTTNFGQSTFEMDDEGYLKSAGYTLDPRLQGIQSGLMGGYAGQLAQAQGLDTSQLMQGGQDLMSLGQGYLSESPEAARQRYISQQQALLDPINEQNLAGLRNSLFQRGRTGLATGGTTQGMAQTNPELAAYYNAQARQQAQLAANADLAAQQQQTFGQGLLAGGADIMGKGYGLQSSAYSPLTTTLGLSEAIEAQGISPFTLGVNLGGRQTQANQYGAGLLNTASQNAALTRQAANQYSPGAAALQGAINSPALQNNMPAVQNWFSTQLNPNNTGSFMYDTGADVFSPSYMGGTSYGE